MSSEAGALSGSGSGVRGAPNGLPCHNYSGNSSALGKRKKVRSRRSDFLHNWLEKAAASAVAPEPDLFPPPPYHPYAAAVPMPMSMPAPPPPLYHQRLFNAASDPTVCRYSSPYAYPHEPLSLPLCAPPYYPFHHVPNSDDFPSGNSSRRKNPKRRDGHKKERAPRTDTYIGMENESIKLQNGKASPSTNAEVASAAPSVTSGVNNEFASLPPAVDHKESALTANGSEETNKSEKRRFSDPGFAQNDAFDGNREESAEDSDSGASSVLYDFNANNRLIMCLVDHINALKDTNRRLHKELHESRGELESLKQQLSIWRGDSASSTGPNNHNPSGSQTGGIAGSSVMYAPGMLADLVREIRDATRVREEAIFNKVRSIMEEKNYNKNNCIPQEKCFQDWRSFDQLKSQHHTTLAEKARTNDRIVKLEEEIYNLRLNPNRDGLSPCSSPGFAITGEERIRIQMELNKERAARAAADARAHKLELLVTQLQSKRGSLGGYATGAPVTPTHSSNLNGMSAGNSGSMGISPDPRQMVLGPITDL